MIKNKERDWEGERRKELPLLRRATQGEPEVELHQRSSRWLKIPELAIFMIWRTEGILEKYILHFIYIYLLFIIFFLSFFIIIRLENFQYSFCNGVGFYLVCFFFFFLG